MSKPRLLDRVRELIRVRQYSTSTEKSYVAWIRRYILFHKKRHPSEMEKAEIEAFLTYLAVDRCVSPSTQNQALQALLFLYRIVLNTEVLHLPIQHIDLVFAWHKKTGTRPVYLILE